MRRSTSNGADGSALPPRVSILVDRGRALRSSDASVEALTPLLKAQPNAKRISPSPSASSLLAGELIAWL